MAVLNPLLASSEKYSDINRVHLLTTAKTALLAERIKIYLVENTRIFPEANVIVTGIANGLVQDRSGNEPCHLAIRKVAADDTVLLNLAGGMNFQVAACVAELHGLTSLFVYPDHEAIHLFTVQNGKFLSFPCPFPKIKVDVLALQGVNYQKEKGLSHRERRFANFLSKCGVTKPEGMLSSIRVGNVLFDAVWSANNVLSFLVYDTPSGTAKNESRILIGTLEDRSLWGELYSRQIIVISAHTIFINRLQNEGRGKVNTILADNKNESFLALIKPKLLKLFGQDAETLPATNRFLECRPQTGGAPVLVTPLGRDPLPTLIALWSHHPRTAYLLYTPDSPDIVTIQQALVQHISYIPVETVHFIPVSLLAGELIDFPSNAEKGRVEVNITPGTKSQCAMLVLWAREHGAIVYSIDNPAGCCRPLTQRNEKDYPLRGPSPTVLIKLSGCKLKGHKIVDWMRENQRSVEQNRLDFLNKCMGREVSLRALFRGRSEDEAISIVVSDTDLTVEFAGSRIEFPRTDGGWFERLVGEALRRCGADDVHLNIATLWDKDIIRGFVNTSGSKNPHMTEIDAVARFGTTYYAVSAKAGMKISLTETINEIKAVATLFGRFAIAVLARLHYQGEPVERNGVWIIGPATLCDSDGMKAFLEQAKRGRRTTEE